MHLFFFSQPNVNYLLDWWFPYVFQEPELKIKVTILTSWLNSVVGKSMILLNYVIYKKQSSFI